MIVDDMKAFLSEAGFQPVREASLVTRSRLAGIVLSTTVATEGGSKLEDVFEMVTRTYAGTPLVIATLLTLVSARRMISGMAPSIPLMDLESAKGVATAQGGILLLRKSDLQDPRLRTEALGRIRSHFTA